MRSFPSLLVSALAAACLAIAAPSACAAAPTDAQALVAIKKIAPTATQINVNVPSHSGTRAAVTASSAATDGSMVDDLWIVGSDGSATAVTNYRGGVSSNAPGFGDPTWSLDDAKLSVATAITGAASSVRVTVYTTGATPTEFAQVPLGLGGTFSADGRYLAVLQLDSVKMQFLESAVDLQSGAVYLAFTGSSSGQIIPTPECARTQAPGWKAADDTGDLLLDWLAGPDPGCTFPTGGAPAATPTPTPTPRPTLAPTAQPTPKPASTSGAEPTPQPTAPGSKVQTGATAAFPLVSFVQSLRATRTRGLRAKIQAPEATTLKAWLIGPDGKTLARSSQRAKAGANVLALPLTPVGIRALRKRRDITVTLRIVGAVGAQVVTVEHHLKLTSR